MTSMVEAAARGIALSLNAREIYISEDTAHVAARAAILAIREPSEAMIASGQTAWVYCDLNAPESDPVRDCYRAMIDTALNEPTQPKGETE